MRRIRKFLPRTTQRRNGISVGEVVALVDRAFTAGYAAKDAGKYLRPSKRRFLENLAIELRQQ